MSERENREAKEVTLLTVPANGIILVRFLTEPRGIITHWTGKKSVACAGLERCSVKLHTMPKTWKAYSAVEMLLVGPSGDGKPARCWVPYVLEVTERLALCLGDESLRGTAWKLFRRKGRRDREEVWGEKHADIDPRILRTDILMERVVQRVYRTLEIEWDAQPLFAPPQYAEPSPAEEEQKAPARPADQKKEEDAVKAENKRKLQEMIASLQAQTGIPPKEGGAK